MTALGCLAAPSYPALIHDPANIVGSLDGREVACLVSDRQRSFSNAVSGAGIWRVEPSETSHHLLGVFPRSG